MRLLVTGATGQIGWELARSLMPLGEVIAVDRSRCDLSRPETIAPLVREVHPDVIVNAAAYTAVDKAESEETIATTINGTAVGVLAEEARKTGAMLVHYSTDYVFDGRKAEPYVEDDTPNPINAYGRSKLAGEVAIQAADCAHIILRTTWVYAARGKNFVRTILRLARERDDLNIVSDQFGAPTSARTIAEATTHIVRLAQQELTHAEFSSCIYHCTALGAINWYGFAKAILEDAIRYRLLGSKPPPKVHAVPTNAYPVLAARPLNSRLDCTRLIDRFSITPPHWEYGLHLVMQELADHLSA